MKQISLFLSLMLLAVSFSYYQIAHSTASDTMPAQQKIQLFGYDQCPYCAKVVNFLQRQNLLHTVELIDVTQSGNLEKLQAISGRTQVPYLVDAQASVSMPESEDIIRYIMKKHNLVYDAIHYEAPDQGVVMNKMYDPKRFLSDLLACKRPVVLLVATNWCPPCQKFKPIFFKVADQYADLCEFVLLDGDANPAIVQELGIPGFPSVICFKDGIRINPVNYRSEEGLVDLIAQLVKK